MPVYGRRADRPRICGSHSRHAKGRPSPRQDGGVSGMHRLAGRLARLAILCAALVGGAPSAHAGPASDLIAKLNTVFIDVMKNAKPLGYEGRYKKLEPALAEAYDFAEMTR